MSRMPANMSLKAFAPRIASPDTTPLYSPMRLSWSVLVVVSSTPYLPSDRMTDRNGSYLPHPRRDPRRPRSADDPTARRRPHHRGGGELCADGRPPPPCIAILRGVDEHL